MRFIRIAACLLATVITLASCSPKAKPPLRVAFNAWPGYEFIALAEDLGYFREEGVAVTPLPFQTLGDGRRAFEKGQVDIMGGTLMELYTIRDNTPLPAAAFLVVDYSNGGDMLLARKSIPTVAALKGKKVAFELGTIDVLTTANALASAQLSFKDVQATPMPQPNAIKALLNGDIDAVQTYPPFATEALADPRIHRLFDTSQTPGSIVDILIANHDHITERADDYRRFIRAFYKARLYHAKNPTDANRRMALREQIKPEEFADALGGIQLVALGEQSRYFTEGRLAKHLQNTHTSLQAIGAIKGPPCDARCIHPIATQPQTPP